MGEHSTHIAESLAQLIKEIIDERIEESDEIIDERIKEIIDERIDEIIDERIEDTIISLENRIRNIDSTNYELQKDIVLLQSDLEKMHKRLTIIENGHTRLGSGTEDCVEWKENIDKISTTCK